VPCTYDYQPKKRGPPNLYLRRLQEAAQQAQRDAAVAHATGNGGLMDTPLSATLPPNAHGLSPLSPHAMQHMPLLSNPPHPAHLRRSPPSIPTLATPVTPGNPSYLSDPPLNPGAPAPIPPSRYPIAADTYTPSPAAGLYGAHHHPFDRPGTADTAMSTTSNGPPSTIAPPSLESTFAHGYTNGTGSSASANGQVYQSWTSPPGVIQYPFKPYQPPPPTYLPPLNYYYRPHRLEDIAPREMLLQIVQLFFDFVYPLTPCIHRPSFMADLSSRREERDPLFFALVMSTIASTLVQVPRSYLPIVERKQVRRLAQLCHEASRHVTVAAYDPPTSTHVVIRYFLNLTDFVRFNSDTVYHFCEGHDATSHASFGEAAHIAVTLHMHEEASYEGLDPIETE
ncbi:13216_t:CDS:2, partial [Acaulospora colombiana]